MGRCGGLIWRLGEVGKESVLQAILLLSWAVVRETIVKIPVTLVAAPFETLRPSGATGKIVSARLREQIVLGWAMHEQGVIWGGMGYNTLV